MDFRTNKAHPIDFQDVYNSGNESLTIRHSFR